MTQNSQLPKLSFSQTVNRISKVTLSCQKYSQLRVANRYFKLCLKSYIRSSKETNIRTIKELTKYQKELVDSVLEKISKKFKSKL